MCIRHLFISPGHNYFGYREQPPGGHPALEWDAIDCRAEQDIRFVGVEECRPCCWMNIALRREQAESWLKGNGGLRAHIRSDGRLLRDLEWHASPHASACEATA